MKLFTILLQRCAGVYAATAFDGAKEIAKGTSFSLAGAFENLANTLPAEYRPTDN